MLITGLNRIASLFLAIPKGVTGEAARFYLFQKFGYFIATGLHFFWAVLFFLNGIPVMGYYNIIVSALFLITGLVWRRIANPMWLCVPLWLIEVPLHAALATGLTGFETLFWLVPIVAAAISLLFHQWSWTTRAMVALALVIFMLACATLGFFVAPRAVFSPPSAYLSMASIVLFTVGGMVMYLGLNQFVVAVTEARLQREYDRAEGLLRNILPDAIALRLKDGETVIADEHAEASVIFADIVNFTQASAKLTPAELVETLNKVFTEFDALAEKHGTEKIKTIGDAYMAVVGIPEAQQNHANVAVDLALDMLASARRISAETHFPIDLRIGINSGPVVAGVIGSRKFAYDLWGDAVNVASRMEAHSEPGTVLITDATKKQLSDRFTLTDAGTREVKGKGVMSVYSVGQAT
ncbi:adenylate/guanylate cyclase domain-containing protein [Sulfitobacter aestuariivivens]|uniref:Adenylate cyclase n=1 Tax=Sulfitobacter aestuariivivens TaxID=2766981 RepID=A0A927HEV3_9RHOB|nr:adenylate/guanylate cyclase domain-containing protein [Sulfitobacter aestuariivivens]MBD3663774.1 adenylate/guanylate cyclase domain-containing protein [Sulfitobacter aestuariivivens]